MSEVTVSNGFLGIGAVNIHVEDSGGTGRPVVLIHGWPLSGAAWSAQVPALRSAGYRIITYDRRGFGRSDKPMSGYDYDTFADDLAAIMGALVGFSMGGGEAARYPARHGQDRLRSVVFASAVTPMLMQSPENPDGPLTEDKATRMRDALEADVRAFYDDFTKQFFSPNADGNILVTEAQRQEALALCMQADKRAALGAMQAFGGTDFRDDLPTITVPALIIHGDADGIVPFEGSGQRTHVALAGSRMHVVAGGPHGNNVSHADEFNSALIDFLKG